MKYSKINRKDSSPKVRNISTKEDTDYDPYLHRVIEKPTTDFDTFIHCIKGSFGSGLLAMPYAFKSSGIITGLIGTPALSMILAYSIAVLVKSQYLISKIRKKPYTPYPFALRRACKLGPPIFKILSPFAPLFVNFFLVTYQLGVCCSYLAFIAGSLKEVLEPEIFKYEMSQHWYLLMILVPILAINTIRSLKRLTPMSLVADVLTGVGLTIIVYYMVGTGPLRLDETTYFGTVVDYPLFFSTVMFSLEAVGVDLALERNMKTPQNFSFVFSFAMGFVIFVYTFIGFMGYAKYAEYVQGSITNTIPKDNALAVFVKILFAVCIFCSYPLQCYVSIEIIWKNYLKRKITNKRSRGLAEYCLRACVISITFIIVLFVRRFELIISFVGAFCLSTLGLILPFTMELCVLWPENSYGHFKYILIKDIAGIVLGFVLLVLGSYVAFLKVIQDQSRIF